MIFFNCYDFPKNYRIIVLYRIVAFAACFVHFFSFPTKNIDIITLVRTRNTRRAADENIGAECASLRV